LPKTGAKVSPVRGPGRQQLCETKMANPGDRWPNMASPGEALRLDYDFAAGADATFSRVRIVILGL
jgi:hypothetical protein